MLRLFVALVGTYLTSATILEEEVHVAQKAWGDGIVEIGELYKNGGEYFKQAALFVDKFYAFGSHKVLFKPTMAGETRTHEHHEFRLTRESALSYMAGGSPEYPEDRGFALKPWTKVRFFNAGFVFEEGIALAMGDYYFTDTKGAETKVEYTFGYARDPHSKDLQIILHHSSMPFKLPELQQSSPLQVVCVIIVVLLFCCVGINIGLAKAGSRRAPSWAKSMVANGSSKGAIIGVDLENYPEASSQQVPANEEWYTVKTKHGMQDIRDVMMDPANWRAGITVALVSVPLSISLGIASGSGPTRGLATAVFGGISAGFFGGSDYNIIGPAGALSGMLMAYSVRWSENVLPWMCLTSFVFIALIRLLRLHTYAALIPNTVFEGFTLAVAFTIGLGQLNFAFGVAPTKKHEHFLFNVMESLNAFGDAKLPSLILFVLQTPALLMLMKNYTKVPWTIIMPLASLPLAWMCSAGAVELLTLKSKYGSLENQLIHPLYSFQSVVPTSDLFSFILSSCGVAVVAVLETLISAKIAASRVNRPFDEDAEVRGLAVAHLVCGAVGGMPPTGVFVRTALNTSLGATHRFSQVLNSIVVGIISLVFMPLFLYLPQATIAAILTVASIRMAPLDFLCTLVQKNPTGFGISMITALICVVTDPCVGLLAGTSIHLFIGNQCLPWLCRTKTEAPTSKVV